MLLSRSVSRTIIWFIFHFNDKVTMLCWCHRGAEGQLLASGCGLDLLYLNYIFILFSFLPSGNGVKRSVKFRHSTPNTSRIRRKVTTGCVLIRMECLNTIPYSRNREMKGNHVKNTLFYRSRLMKLLYY